MQKNKVCKKQKLATSIIWIITQQLLCASLLLFKGCGCDKKGLLNTFLQTCFRGHTFTLPIINLKQFFVQQFFSFSIKFHILSIQEYIVHFKNMTLFLTNIKCKRMNSYKSQFVAKSGGNVCSQEPLPAHATHNGIQLQFSLLVIIDSHLNLL